MQAVSDGEDKLSVSVPVAFSGIIKPWQSLLQQGTSSFTSEEFAVRDAPTDGSSGPGTLREYYTLS